MRASERGHQDLMKKTYVSLDLETTGLDPEADEIIEIGMAKSVGGRMTDTFHTLVNPRRTISYRIQVLCGIEQSQLDDSPTFSEIAGDLRSFIGDHTVIGHNISFDLGFLEQKGFSPANDIYDTWELATILLSQQADYTLATLADEFDLTRPEHRALPDAMAAMDLFMALHERALELDLSTLEELVRLSEKADWKLGSFFRGVLEAKAKTAFSAPGRAVSPRTGAHASGLVAGGGERTLEPPAEQRALDIDALSNLLEPDGLLARSLPVYEYRPGQIAMMRAVAQAINDGEHLLVEAGTGTGKSIAYLLPSIVYSLENSAPVVISTNTINLQEQLTGKDIPDLLRALSEYPDVSVRDLKVAQLKGRSNYLCLKKYDSLRAGRRLSLEEVRLLARLTVWLLSTETGDRAELRLSPPERSTWSKLCAEFDDRFGGQCPYRQRGACYLYRARQAAECAHLIVVNHALLLSDMAAEAKILPAFSHLVVDEAHHLEDETTDQLGSEVTQWDLLNYLGQFKLDAEGQRTSGLLNWLEVSLKGSTVASSRQRRLKQLAEAVGEHVDMARVHSSEFVEKVRDFVENHSEDQGGYDRQVLLTRDKRVQPGWSRIEIAWDDLDLALTGIQNGLDQLYIGLEGHADSGIAGYDHLMLEISLLFSQCGELRRQLSALISQPSADDIYWLAVSGQSNAVSLHAAPLSVGRILNDLLFTSKDCVVLTGATLSTGDNFDYIRGRLGLEDVNELLLGAPFDYSKSTLLYLPHDAPDPGSRLSQQTLERMVVDLGRACRGRTLVLFTSHAALRATQAAVQGPLEEDGIMVLAHGVDGTPRQLLTAFKANPEAVLLGTASFWEGVDIVGDALSVLVIVRLPFSVPTEPVFAARSQMVDDSFNQFAVPQAAIRFKQGFGRLIRSKSDRGVVVVFDRRLQTKRYGAAFLESIPECTVVRGMSGDVAPAAVRWLMAARNG